MNIRNIVIALVIAGVACAGAVTWTSTQGGGAGESLVTSRPVGVAYAQDGGTGAPPPPAGDPAAPAGDAAAADAAAAAPAENLTDEQWLQKLEEWKNSDPREIVEKKYDDLNSRQTHPQNEDDPEQFIPETGRVDPLTIVSGAIPDELKPPRSGETDQNAVKTYLFAEMATGLCDMFGRSIDVYNVIQIGLAKRVSLTWFGDKGFVDEGDQFQFYAYSAEGWPVLMTFACIDAGTDQVVMSITAQPEGSNVFITKNFTFIPR